MLSCTQLEHLASLLGSYASYVNGYESSASVVSGRPLPWALQEYDLYAVILYVRIIRISATNILMRCENLHKTETKHTDGTGAGRLTIIRLSWFYSSPGRLTMLQAGRSPVRVLDEVDFFQLT
jgi:hypothetical protein